MKAVLFDLDNTLYDAKQYFEGAFRSISKYLSEKYLLCEKMLYDQLMKLWEKKTSMYPRLFDDFLNLINLDLTEVKNLIEIFNGYCGKLKPYDDVIPTLKELKKMGYKLGIITDGNPTRQKRKIKLLGLEGFFDTIVFTKYISPKPSPLPYMEALNRLNIIPSNAYYVGDNPMMDFKGAKEVGITTIRILRGEFIDVPRNEYIDIEIKNMVRLLQIIR